MAPEVVVPGEGVDNNSARPTAKKWMALALLTLGVGGYALYPRSKEQSPADQNEISVQKRTQVLLEAIATITAIEIGDGGIRFNGHNDFSIVAHVTTSTSSAPTLIVLERRPAAAGSEEGADGYWANVQIGDYPDNFPTTSFFYGESDTPDYVAANILGNELIRGCLKPALDSASAEYAQQCARDRVAIDRAQVLLSDSTFNYASLFASELDRPKLSLGDGYELRLSRSFAGLFCGQALNDYTADLCNPAGQVLVKKVGEYRTTPKNEDVTSAVRTFVENTPLDTWTYDFAGRLWIGAPFGERDVVREAFFEKRATVAGHPEEWTLAFLNGENCEVVAAYLTPTDEMAIASALQARVNETLQVFANVLETFLDPQRSGLPTDPAAWQNDIFRERSFTTQVKGFEITLIQEGVDRLLGADMGPKYLLEIKGGQPIGRERQKKLLHRLELEPTDPAVALLKKLRRS